MHKRITGSLLLLILVSATVPAAAQHHVTEGAVLKLHDDALANANARIAALETQILQQTKDMATLRASYSTLQSELEKAHAIIAANNANLKEAGLAADRARIELTGDIKDRDRDIIELQGMNKRLNADLSTLRKELTDAQANLKAHDEFDLERLKLLDQLKQHFPSSIEGTIPLRELLDFMYGGPRRQPPAPAPVTATPVALPHAYILLQFPTDAATTQVFINNRAIPWSGETLKLIRIPCPAPSTLATITCGHVSMQVEVSQLQHTFVDLKQMAISVR